MEMRSRVRSLRDGGRGDLGVTLPPADGMAGLREVGQPRPESTASPRASGQRRQPNQQENPRTV